MTTTTTYIHTTTSKPSTLLLVKTILCFSWQINCKIEEIILKQRTYSPPTTILPTALILKAVSICCISDELSTRNTCMGFGLWRRNGHKQFCGENRALYFWKRVFITKTWPCPNTCLTKTEGYDHILRFEIIFFRIEPPMWRAQLCNSSRQILTAWIFGKSASMWSPFAASTGPPFLLLCRTPFLRQLVMKNQIPGGRRSVISIDVQKLACCWKT